MLMVEIDEEELEALREALEAAEEEKGVMDVVMAEFDTRPKEKSSRVGPIHWKITERMMVLIALVLGISVDYLDVELLGLVVAL